MGSSSHGIRIPKLCLHRPSGLAYVTLPGKPKGRVVYLGPYGTAEAETKYRATLSDWLAGRSGEEGVGGAGRAVAGPLARVDPVPSTGPTVAEVGAKFAAWAASYYVKRGKPTSQVPIVEAAVAGLAGAFGAMPAADFGARNLKSLRDRVVESGLTRGGVNRRIAIVKQCLAWAVEEGLIPPAGWHSCLAVKGLKRGRSLAPEPEAVPPAPIEDIRAAMRAMPAQVAAMVELQLLTGMRPGEASQVRRCDLDEAATPWIYTPDSHKGEHHGIDRKIPIGPRAQNLLIAWFVPDDPEAYLFHPRGRGRGPSARVDPRKRYAPDSYCQAVARACNKAGVPRWHPNQLRHTFGTLVRARYGLEASQVSLGHAKADVTQIYAERDLKKAAEIAAEIG